MENRIKATLDDALNTFVAENDQPTADNLQEWVSRYPQFRQDLVEFAAVWAQQLVLPRAAEMGAEAEKILLDRAMSHVINVAYSCEEEERAQAARNDPIVSLTGEAQRVKMKPSQLAKACGLDLALLSKLTNRQIKPQTIPVKLIRLLARHLRKTTTAVRAYFTHPPRAATGKAFLSRGRPRSVGQQSFADAVRSSSLSAEERARWLDEVAVEES